MESKSVLVLKKAGAKSLLDVIAYLADKNANILCKGLLYEPVVPKKLKKIEQLWRYENEKRENCTIYCYVSIYAGNWNDSIRGRLPCM